MTPPANGDETDDRSGPAHAEGETRDEQEREVAAARRRQRGSEPHGELSSPARDPDPTADGDPYEKDADAEPSDRDAEGAGTAGVEKTGGDQDAEASATAELVEDDERRDQAEG